MTPNDSTSTSGGKISFNNHNKDIAASYIQNQEPMLSPQQTWKTWFLRFLPHRLCYFKANPSNSP